MDDDFNSTLDPKWTVTEGTLGTVSLTTTASGPIYDLSSVPGFLACQVENNKLSLRQDYTLPDGKSVVLKLHPALNASSNLADEVKVGLALNTSDTSPTSVTSSGCLLLEFNATLDGWRIYGENRNTSNAVADNTAIGDAGDESPYNGGTVYLRISRVGSAYIWLCSFDGLSWVPMKAAQTPATVYTNVWIRVRSDAASGAKILPVQLIDWVKEVDNTVFQV